MSLSCNPFVSSYEGTKRTTTGFWNVISLHHFQGVPKGTWSKRLLLHAIQVLMSIALIHLWSYTWNLKISPWRRRFLLETMISGSIYPITLRIHGTNGIFTYMDTWFLWDQFVGKYTVRPMDPICMCKLKYFCDAFSCMCTNVEQSNLYMSIPTTYLQAIIGCQYIQHALVSLTFDSIHGVFCHKDKTKTVLAAEKSRIELFPTSWGLKAAGWWEFLEGWQHPTTIPPDTFTMLFQHLQTSGKVASVDKIGTVLEDNMTSYLEHSKMRSFPPESPWHRAILRVRHLNNSQSPSVKRETTAAYFPRVDFSKEIMRFSPNCKNMQKLWPYGKSENLPIPKLPLHCHVLCYSLV